MEELPEPYQSLFEAMLWDCGAEAVAELVRKGADLAFCDPTGRTALYAATMSDRVRTIEALLQHGAEPNQRLTYRPRLTVERRPAASHFTTHLPATLPQPLSGRERR